MRNVKRWFITGCILCTTACKKDVSKLGEPQSAFDSTKIYTLPSTPQDTVITEDLGKVTGMLKELYKEKSNLKLVNASIFAKAYTDESILLKKIEAAPMPAYQVKGVFPLS